MTKVISLALLVALVLLGISEFASGEGLDHNVADMYLGHNLGASIFEDHIEPIIKREANPGNNKKNDGNAGRKNKQKAKKKDGKKAKKNKNKKKKGKSMKKKKEKRGNQKRNKKNRNAKRKEKQKKVKKVKKSKGKQKKARKARKDKKRQKKKGKNKQKKKRKNKNKKKRTKAKKSKKNEKGKTKKDKTGKAKNTKTVKQATCSAEEADNQCLINTYDAYRFEAIQITNLLKQVARSESFVDIMRKKNKKNDTFQNATVFIKQAIGDPNNISCESTTVNKTEIKETYLGLVACNETVSSNCDIDSKTTLYNQTALDFLAKCKMEYEAFQTKNKACSNLTPSSEICRCFSAQIITDKVRLQEMGCNPFSAKFQDDIKRQKDTCVANFGICRSYQKKAVNIVSACSSGVISV